MAARSAVSFASSYDDNVSGDSGNQGGNSDDAAPLQGAKTPSRARAEQELDTTAGITPSRARSEEPYELQNGQNGQSQTKDKRA